MKRKITISLDEDIFRLSRKRAREEGQPFSVVVQNALRQYLADKLPEDFTRLEAYRTFCERPIRISREDLKYLVKEDR